MSTEDFVTYKQALSLRKLGFDEPCLYSYSKNGTLFSHSALKADEYESIYVENLLFSLNKVATSEEVCDAPTLWQAQKWIRENKDIIIEVGFYLGGWDCHIFNIKENSTVFSEEIDASYEEVLSTGITQYLKSLENVEI